MARKAAADLDNPAVVERLCDHLASGLSMQKACAEEGMPSKSVVYQRMAADEEFRTRIARAREAQQEAIIDETVEMADTATADDWQVVKLRIWARQWRASKLAPKKYGDKLDVTSGGDRVGRDPNEVEAVTRLASLASSILGRAGDGTTD